MANKIAVEVGTAGSLSLEVTNISSLSASDVGAVSQNLVAELTQRHFRLFSPASTPASEMPAQVHITLSEGVEGLVWVAEIRPTRGSEDERQVAMVRVPKQASQALLGAKDSLTLDKKLVWEQADEFLDFVSLPQSSGLYSTLLILEPGRLAFYRLSGAEWQLWQSVTMAQPGPRSRDVFGHINGAAETISLPGFQCAGDFEQPQSLECRLGSQSPGDRNVEIPGREAGEAAELRAKCNGASVLLGTGTGDWTQPDSIQGFELANSQEAIPSGDPIAMDGPVISLWAPPDESDARAIVHNLQSGHYEGYIVTATCNH